MGFNKVYLASLFNQKNIIDLSDVSVKEYKRIIKDLDVPAESVNGGRQCKPYIDADPVKSSLHYTETDWNADILLNKQTILAKFAGTDLTIADIYAIKRKYQVDGGIKCSVHYIVDKIRMSACNMRTLFEDIDIEGFDKAVYSNNRFLTSIYTTKKIVNGLAKDFPPFMPDGDAHISKYLPSYVEEEFEDWDLKFAKTDEIKPIKKEVSGVLEQISANYENVDLIKGLMDCLSDKRADEYSDWLNVGFCLYNINPNTLDLWIAFSKKSDKYKEGECDKLWNTMSKKGVSIGSLKYWAKLDNPEQYKKVINESLETIINDVLGSDGAHFDIACFTAKLMADKVVYDGKMKRWYCVDEKTNIWECDKEGIIIIKVLAVDVCRVFMETSDKYAKKAFDCDSTLKDMYEEKSKKCISVAKQLKNSSFQDSVKKCCKCTFMKNDFFEKFIDKKIELFAFTNCVFDCNTKMFRLIEPTDYIMTTTGYDWCNYVSQFYIDDFMKILITIQPDAERRAYLLDDLSLRLFGKNFLQLFTIWSGEGANGKGFMVGLLDLIFGDYFGKLSSNTITKETKSANATSEFSAVSSCRTVLFEEPKKQSKLQTDILKEHSGDTAIRTRGLFQESFEYVPQYGMIICCNDIPDLEDNGGHAIARRLRVINFPTKFCENPIKPNEKKCDSNLNEKVMNDENYRNAFIKILIDNWIKKDLKTNFKTPDCIKNDSAKYIEDCNYVKRFLDDGYEYSEYNSTNRNAKIQSSVLFSDFKYYCSTNNIDAKISDKEFKRLVETQGFPCQKIGSMYYKNIVKKVQEDEENEE